MNQFQCYFSLCADITLAISICVEFFQRKLFNLLPISLVKVINCISNKKHKNQLKWTQYNDETFLFIEQNATCFFPSKSFFSIRNTFFAILWRFFVCYGQGYLALWNILRNIICVKVTTCNFPWKKCSLKQSSERDFFHLIQKCICAKVFVSLDELQWKMCKTIAAAAVPATAAQAPTHKMTAGKSEWLKNNRMLRLNVVEGKSTTVSGEINLNVWFGLCVCDNVCVDV